METKPTGNGNNHEALNEEATAQAEVEAFLKELDDEMVSIFEVFHRGLLPEKMMKSFQALIVRKNNAEAEDERAAAEFAIMNYAVKASPIVKKIIEKMKKEAAEE